ncbi:hypothetical protein BH10PSE7_BH10PSE7_05350 [soil metagenome]
MADKIGTPQGDYLESYNSTDRIDGRGGDDYLLLTRLGLLTDLVVNISQGGEGIDIGDGTTITSIERLNFYGGFGNDLVIAADDTDELHGGGGDDSLDGGGNEDYIYGGSGSDVIHGGDARDFLYDFIGHNALYGDAGDDNIHSGSSGDTLDGGTGSDHLRLYRQHTSISLFVDFSSRNVQDIGDGTIISNFGVLDFTGGDGADTVTGGSSSDSLFGSGGNDILNGAFGNDQLFGEAGFNVLNGGAGADSLWGGVFDLRNAGFDTLNGDGGDDYLYGGEARDVLRGGLGKDLFYFHQYADSPFSVSHDVILDFSQEQNDQISFLRLLPTAATLSPNDGRGAFSHTVGEIRFFYRAGATFIQVDGDGDGKGNMIVELAGKIALQPDDFGIT